MPIISLLSWRDKCDAEAERLSSIAHDAESSKDAWCNMCDAYVIGAQSSSPRHDRDVNSLHRNALSNDRHLAQRIPSPCRPQTPRNKVEVEAKVIRDPRGPHTFPPDEVWYLKATITTYSGPYPAALLGEWFDRGKLAANRLVRRGTTAEWYAVGRVVGIPLVIEEPSGLSSSVVDRRDPRDRRDALISLYEGEVEPADFVAKFEAEVEERFQRIVPILRGTARLPVDSWEDLLQVIESRTLMT